MSGLTVAAPPGERLRLDHNERLFPAPELVRLLSRVPESALARYPEAAGLEESFGAAWDLDAGRVLATAERMTRSTACVAAISPGDGN